MGKSGHSNSDKHSFDETLRGLSIHKGFPKSAYFLFLLLYILAIVVVNKTARNHDAALMIMGAPVPVTAFTGVFSALGNVCIIFLAVFYRKLGYFTALIACLIQFPILFIKLVVMHSFANLPGVFSNAFTIVAISIIFFNNMRIEQYQNKLRNQAVIDSLTGLPNRYACTELMSNLLKRGVEFAVVSIDLNNFKSINDSMGHEVGNKVLIEVANRWKKMANSWMSGTADFVTRLGGDEFALVIRGYGTEDDVIKTIRLYEKELEKKMTIDECDYFMTACFGYVIVPEDANSVSTALSNADMAMHEIKRLSGSESLLRFTDNLLNTEQSLEMERKIRTALDNNLIDFHLQPQYNMVHELRGFEALARMKNLDGTYISPGEFIPVAEKTGLISRVDKQVFEQAAKFLADVLKEKESDLTISVNVSVKHLMKNDFMEEIKEVLEKTGLPARNLEVEITESIMIDSAEKALHYINELKEMGAKIAIDDFGTGYSSLSYLNKLPADLLKIDKAFIDQMNSGDSSKRYVETIISIGHTLDLEVISEGVESADQISTLMSIGCDYIQGFVWGRPMPAEEARKLVLGE